MKLRKTMVGVLTFLGLSAAAGEGRSIEDILQRHEHAMGGSGAWADIKTVKMTGRYTIYGNDYDLVLLKRKPNHMAILLSNGETEIQVGYNGETARIWIKSEGGEPRDDDDVRTKIFMECFAGPEGPLMRSREKGYSVTLEENAVLNGKAVLALRVIRDSGREELWYLDPESFLPLKRTTRVDRETYGYEQVVVFDDYRQVGGLILPFYFEREDYQHVREYTIEAVSLNPELGDEEENALMAWLNETAPRN